jgi:hypothetical protein
VIEGAQRLKVKYQVEGGSKRFAFVERTATVAEALQAIAGHAKVELESIWDDDVLLEVAHSRASSTRDDLHREAQGASDPATEAG